MVIRHQSIRTEWGVQFDCVRNGCSASCEYHGKTIATYDIRPTSDVHLDGHKLRVVRRDVMYTSWEVVGEIE